METGLGWTKSNSKTSMKKNHRQPCPNQRHCPTGAINGEVGVGVGGVFVEPWLLKVQPKTEYRKTPSCVATTCREESRGWMLCKAGGRRGMIGIPSAVIRAFFRSVMVKKELKQKANILTALLVKLYSNPHVWSSDMDHVPNNKILKTSE